MKFYQKGVDLVIFLLFVSSGLILLFMPIIYCPQYENNPEIMTERNLFPPPPRSYKPVHFLQNNFSHLSLQYIEHSPISINGNTDFNATAASEGWLGDGTSSSPYVIDGLNITGPSDSPLIDIQATDIYFRISNCYISGGLHGIVLNDIIPGRVTLSNNVITNQSEMGIGIRQSGNITISGNRISHNGWSAIHLDDSENTVFLNNTVTNNGGGIYVASSGKSRFSGNIISNNEWPVYFIHSENTVFMNNTVTNHTDGGTREGIIAIFLFDSRNSVILRNFISNNHRGIDVFENENTTISENLISNNTWAGITFHGMNNITLSDNIISNNRVGIHLSDIGYIGSIFNSTNYILNNILVNNGLTIDREAFDEWNDFFLTVVNNTVNGKPLVYWQNVQGGTIPSGAGQVVLVNCTAVTVTAQRLTNVSIGVSAFFSSNLIIHENFIANNSIAGISITESENCTVYANFILGNSGDGIYVAGNDSTISNNTISDNIWSGITIGSDSDNIEISNNLLVNNSLDIEDYQQADNISFINNSINSKPLVYWFKISGGTVPSGAGQVFLVNCDSVEVTGQNLVGLQGVDCTNLLIHHNNVSSGDGIYLSSSVNSSLTNNTIANNDWDGISISSSGSSSLIDNTVVNNGEIGIKIQDSDFNILSGNTVTNNSLDGINLQDCYVNTISGNTVTNNSLNGIFLQHSGSNTVSGNTIAHNSGAGIHLDYNSYNNTVRYNDFYGNNGSQAYGDGSASLFAYNFWDDWTSPDIDGNGIIDNPYLIAGRANNTDTYPLALPAPSHQLSLPIITSPTGGGTLKGTVTIQWTAITDSWEDQIYYTVYYSADGGNTWDRLRGDLMTTNTNWDTTSVADGFAYLIKVIATCSGGNTTEDVSDSLLSIHNSLFAPTLLSPNGGENLSGIIVIRWSAAIDPLNHDITYSLYYSSDGGTTWKSIVAGLTTTSYTSVTFPLIDGSTYLIKVIATCSDGVTTEDTSNRQFSIRNNTLYFSIGRVGLLGTCILGALYFGRRVKLKYSMEKEFTKHADNLTRIERLLTDLDQKISRVEANLPESYEKLTQDLSTVNVNLESLKRTCENNEYVVGSKRLDDQLNSNLNHCRSHIIHLEARIDSLTRKLGD